MRGIGLNIDHYRSNIQISDLIFKMAVRQGRTRNDSWKNDLRLKEDMSTYVRCGYKRKEIIDFLERDYPQYAWSFRSLDRQMREFAIYFTDKDVTVDQVKDAVKKELEGPGKLIGYRAMHNKIRQEYELNVPRDLVHDVMYELDPDGLAARRPGKNRGKKKGHFATKGVDWVHSLDGHDKLMGFQNSTFPIAIYRSIDTASRRIML